MAKQKELREGWARDLALDAIWRSLDASDGWTVLAPEAYTEAGVPAAVVAAHTHEHRSDGSWKGSLTRAGKPLAAVTGVYGLTWVESLLDALGLPQPWQMGRGSRYGHAVETLRGYCAATGVEVGCRALAGAP